MDLLDALGIDWRQIVTNLVGFALFWWIMAKFAWKPILDFMDKRREEIAGNYQKIDDEKAELLRIRKEYESHLAKIEDEATKRIQEAVREGQEAAKLIEEQARAKAKAIVDKARVDTDRIVAQAKLDLKDYIVELGVIAGRKAASGTLDEGSHRRLVEKFVEDLADVR